MINFCKKEFVFNFLQPTRQRDVFRDHVQKLLRTKQTDQR